MQLNTFAKYSRAYLCKLGQLPAVAGLPRDLYFPMLTNSPPPSLFLTPSSCGITMTQSLWDPVVSMCPTKALTFYTPTDTNP